MSRFDELFKSRHPNIQTSGHLDTHKQFVPQVSKSKNPDFIRTTVYLPKEIHRALKVAAAEEGQEMSDITSNLIQEWLESRTQTSKHPGV